MRITLFVLACLLLWIHLLTLSNAYDYRWPLKAKKMMNCVDLRQQASQIREELQSLEGRIAKAQMLSDPEYNDRFLLLKQFLNNYLQFQNVKRYRDLLTDLSKLTEIVKYRCWSLNLVCWLNILSMSMCPEHNYVSNTPSYMEAQRKIEHLDRIWMLTLGNSTLSSEIKGKQRLLEELHTLTKRSNEVQQFSHTVLTAQPALNISETRRAIAMALCTAIIDLNALQVHWWHVLESDTYSKNESQFLGELIQVVEQQWHIWLDTLNRSTGPPAFYFCWQPWFSIYGRLSEDAKAVLRDSISKDSCKEPVKNEQFTPVAEGPQEFDLLKECSKDWIQFLNLTQYEAPTDLKSPL